MNRSILIVVFATVLKHKGLFSRFYRFSGLKMPFLTDFEAENALFPHFEPFGPGREPASASRRIRSPAETRATSFDPPAAPILKHVNSPFRRMGTKSLSSLILLTEG